MKKVFSDANITRCDMAKVLLESSGVFCVLKNEYTSRTAAAGMPSTAGFSLPFAWPELWVSDEEFEKALEVLNAEPETETDKEGIQPTNAP